MRQAGKKKINKPQLKKALQLTDDFQQQAGPVGLDAYLGVLWGYLDSPEMIPKYHQVDAKDGDYIQVLSDLWYVYRDGHWNKMTVEEQLELSEES
jgi:hypothetical protein